MRRTQFITAAVVAAITFFSLHAFVGPHYWGPGGWYGRPGWGYSRHNHYGPWDSRRYRYDPRYDGKNAPAPVQPEDTTGQRY